MNTSLPTIRLIAIDIDGTLLNAKKQIAPRTLEAILAARDAGIIITLATARRYYNTAHIASELNIEIPLILYDGALIMNHPAGTVVVATPLAAEVAQQVVDVLVRHKVQPVVHHINGSMEELWTGTKEFDNDWVAGYFATVPHEIVRLPYESCCVGRPDPLRVVAFTSEETVYELIPEISSLHCSWNITKRGSYNTAELAVMNPQCSKASGVRTLAERLAIPLEQVMAIGDNYNDIEMLRAAGLGVAMGQSPDEVKAVVQAVTGSNEEDGVAQAIEYYALSRRPRTDSNSINRAICL
jgi:Cof subfamily protein (haloacid dehalogenase superfamily)